MKKILPPSGVLLYRKQPIQLFEPAAPANLHFLVSTFFVAEKTSSLRARSPVMLNHGPHMHVQAPLLLNVLHLFVPPKPQGVVPSLGHAQPLVQPAWACWKIDIPSHAPGPHGCFFSLSASVCCRAASSRSFTLLECCPIDFCPIDCCSIFSAATATSSADTYWAHNKAPRKRPMPMILRAVLENTGICLISFPP